MTARPPPLHQPPLHPCPHPALAGAQTGGSQGLGTHWADPTPSKPLRCQGSELLLQRGVFQPSKHTPVPQKPAGPRSKVHFSVSTQRFPSPEMRLRCRCSARSDTYLLRLPQVVLGSAREETAGQVVEWAQPLLGHWYPGDAAPTREEPRLASIALWLTGEG